MAQAVARERGDAGLGASRSQAVGQLTETIHTPGSVQPELGLATWQEWVVSNHELEGKTACWPHMASWRKRA